MNKLKVVPLLFYLSLIISDISSRQTLPQNNFVILKINSHGEREMRVSYRKVLALETFMPSGYSSVYDMTLRQLTDGRHILQAVYQGGSMKECDYSKDSRQIFDFISNFMSFDYQGNEFGNVFTSLSQTNYTRKNILLAYRPFKHLNYLREYSDVVDTLLQIRECKNFLRKAAAVVKMDTMYGNFTDIYTTIIDNTEPEKISDINHKLSPDTEINSRPNRHSVHIGTQEKIETEHNLSKLSANPERRKRIKRSSFDFSSVLIFPGTKWCGKGDLAKCYDDLGDDKELDVCCRDHDCCPFVIPPFSNKFGIFNYRFHSLLHCDCDQRFRGCLRESPSSMANMIGKIYFNILGSKCFQFTETEVCTDRSWWGRCKTYENKTIAEVKSQVSFLDKDGHQDYAVVEK